MTELSALAIIVVDQHHLGITNIPPHQLPLFQHNPYELLDKPANVKRQWLISLIIAREYIYSEIGKTAPQRTKL